PTRIGNRLTGASAELVVEPVADGPAAGGFEAAASCDPGELAAPAPSDDFPGSGRLLPVMVGCCLDHECALAPIDRPMDVLQADKPRTGIPVAGDPFHHTVAVDVAA